jgi:hypothetical protein
VNYDKILKIIDKGVISINELRALTAEELVSSLSSAKPDNRYKNCTKYEIRLENGEMHYVYVKI